MVFPTAKQDLRGVTRGFPIGVEVSAVIREIYN
jgi:hypothetical protein